MLFTVDNIEDLNKQIEVFHLNFIAQNVGVAVLSRRDRKLLTDAGINYRKYKDNISTLQYSYYFGKIESSLRGSEHLNKINFKQYQNFIKSYKGRLKLSRLDAAAIREVRAQAYNDVKRLSADMQSDFSQLLIDASKTQKINIERLLKKQIKAKDISTDAMMKISKHLAGNVKKWMNRIELITRYTMHEAYQYGITIDLLERKGNNVRVWYSVRPDACDNCKRLYLRKDGVPKIFYLKVLIANGNNIGKKKEDLKPSTSPIHPRCRCKMNLYVSKSKWDFKTRSYKKIHS